MKFPVVRIPNRKGDFPELFTTPRSAFLQDPVLLTSRGEGMRDSLFYSIDGVFKIRDVYSARKASFWNLLVHRNEPGFWNLNICFDRWGDYTISDIVGRLEESIESQPNDVWMQFHEKEVILHLLRDCKSIAEVMTVCCLVGAWEADMENHANLPQLHDNSDEYDPETISEALYVMNEQYSGKLTRASIQCMANNIRFSDL